MALVDGPGPDRYGIVLGNGNDTLDVTDAGGVDTYRFLGLENGASPPGDTVKITDAFRDGDDIEITGFETKTGDFQ